MIVENKFTGRKIGKKQTKVRMLRKENVESPIRKRKLREEIKEDDIVDLKKKYCYIISQTLSTKDRILAWDKQDGDFVDIKFATDYVTISNARKTLENDDFKNVMTGFGKDPVPRACLFSLGVIDFL